MDFALPRLFPKVKLTVKHLEGFYMTVFMVLMLVVQTGVLVATVFMVRELQQVREMVSGQLSISARLVPRGRLSASFVSTDNTYAIWCWRGTCWELDMGSVPTGYEPGNPPSFQGSFLNQRVKAECTRC